MNPTTTTTINEEDSIIIRKNVCLTNAMMKKVANYAAQSDRSFSSAVRRCIQLAIDELMEEARFTSLSDVN